MIKVHPNVCSVSRNPVHSSVLFRQCDWHKSVVIFLINIILIAVESLFTVKFFCNVKSSVQFNLSSVKEIIQKLNNFEEI